MAINNKELLMVEKFKAKLKEEGRSCKWFVDKYLPKRYYGTVMLMLNQYAVLQDDVKLAIVKYLKDEE